MARYCAINGVVAESVASGDSMAMRWESDMMAPRCESPATSPSVTPALSRGPLESQVRADGWTPHQARGDGRVSGESSAFTPYNAPNRTAASALKALKPLQPA